jgi:hypothetical protein
MTIKESTWALKKHMENKEILEEMLRRNFNRPKTRNFSHKNKLKIAFKKRSMLP